MKIFFALKARKIATLCLKSLTPTMIYQLIDEFFEHHGFQEIFFPDSSSNNVLRIQKVIDYINIIYGLQRFTNDDRRYIRKKIRLLKESKRIFIVTDLQYVQ
jgi:hypothetical protein